MRFFFKLFFTSFLIFPVLIYGYAPQNFHSVETEESEDSDPIIGGFFYNKHTASACYFHANRELVPSHFTKVNDSLTTNQMEFLFPGLPPCDFQKLDFLRWAALNTDHTEGGSVQVAGSGFFAGRVFQWLATKRWAEVLNKIFFPVAHPSATYSSWWKAAAASGTFGCGLGMINGLMFYFEQKKLEPERREVRETPYIPTPYINDQGDEVPHINTTESVILGSITGILSFASVTESLFKVSSVTKGGFIGFVSGASLTGTERACSNWMYQIPLFEEP